MIVLTGGAGFIGSCFLWKLNAAGIDDIIIVDDFGNPDKKLNLIGKKYRDFIQKDAFLRLVTSDSLEPATCVIHMGACSSTIETDVDYLRRNNFEYSVRLAEWALRKKASFLYASSAATYGDGRFGYDDSNKNTLRLQPLSPYGESKQLFDQWVVKHGFNKRVTGFKFFNVFGPNEYHKKEMKSVICRNYYSLAAGNPMRLFKSYNPSYPDGTQKRDFVYVLDVIEAMYYFFCNPQNTGIYNLGTGKARSWNDLAAAIFCALGVPPSITYVDMPENIRAKYQYFTEATMDKMRRVGYTKPFRSLEESVADYCEYLRRKARL
ncbi:MAG TPA: ADP-glyceromanno-heptose 6-epimerase [Candidatus Omnitrophota bacterium]|nr:ADP-glyceromanno-heptose 6-epimerase [Candidatus Omnitrophota bacterium]